MIEAFNCIGRPMSAAEDVERIQQGRGCQRNCRTRDVISSHGGGEGNPKRAQVELCGAGEPEPSKEQREPRVARRNQKGQKFQEYPAISGKFRRYQARLCDV